MSPEQVSREVLSSRTLGQVLPISIATALAIESLIGENPDAPEEGDHLDIFTSLYINVRTLTRNLLGAIQTSDKNVIISPSLILEYVMGEMSAIVSLLKEDAPDKNVIFYSPSYKESYTKSFKHGILKEYKTKQQAYYFERESFVEDLISEEIKKNKLDTTIIDIDTEIPTDRVDVVILTHYPIDLLSRYNFKSLNLIESHTGAIKGPSEWYTKLTGYKDRPPIPFDRAMLQIFGDGTMFLSSKRKIRTTIIDLATKYKWTYRSTEDLVKFSVAKLNDPFMTKYVNELYKS